MICKMVDVVLVELAEFFSDTADLLIDLSTDIADFGSAIRDFFSEFISEVADFGFDIPDVIFCSNFLTKIEHAYRK